MADSNVAVTEGSGKNIDTRTNAGGDHRQVIVIGHESANDSVASVQAADPSSSALGVVVREPNTTAIVSGLRDVRVQSIVDGTVGVENVTRVKNLVDGTLSLVTRVDRVFNLVDGTIGAGTLDYVTRVRNIVDGTLTTVTFVPTVQRVQNVIDGTLSTVTGVDRIRNIVDGTITTVTGVDRVRNIVDGTISTITRVDRVMNVVDGTITVASITSSANVHILSTNGTMAVNIGTIAGSAAVYFSPSKPVVLADNQHTAGIFTVTGSTSGGTTSGVTLVAPSASYNFKVFAYSLQTTGIVSEAWRFTNGGGTETELWRPLVTAAASSSSPVGANLAVPPPAFIFATGVNTTLALKSSTGSLVHYSVSYIKESA